MDSNVMYTFFLSFLLLKQTMLCSAAAFPPLRKLPLNRHVVQTNYIQDFFLITEEDANPEPPCENCTESGMTSPIYNNKLIEKVKARILSSLHLTEVPKKKSVPKLQTLRFPGYDDQNRNTNIGNDFQELETETLFSQVSEMKCSGDSEKSCIRFQIKLSKRMKQLNVNSAVLWMYKRRGVRSLSITQHIFDFKQGTMRTQNTTASDQEENHGWIRFDARSALTSMFSNKDRILDLEISSDGESSSPLEATEKRKPFLMVNINISSHANGRRIAKRSIKECEEENSTCCRQRYYVNFADIGWGDWIVEPKGYWANFCKGSCRHEAGFARDLHSTVLILLLANNASEARRAGINVNCVPKALKSMAIIHADEGGVEVNMNVPNMIVEECACA